MIRSAPTKRRRVTRFPGNENFPRQVVWRLRELGYDVLTSLEAGQANKRIPDEEVLAFATSQRRVLLTQNRRDFLRIHNAGNVPHTGIVLCTADAEFLEQAKRISEAVSPHEDNMDNVMIRVNRPAQ